MKNHDEVQLTQNPNGFNPSHLPPTNGHLQTDIPLSPINTENQKNKLQVECVSDLLHEPTMATEWLIKGIWVEGSAGFVAGNPGVGKTWLVLDMLISIVTGQRHLNKFKIPSPGPCLIISAETSRPGLQRRIQGLSLSRGLNPSDLKNLFHITMSQIKIPDHTNDIIKVIKKYGIRAVVFDPLRRFHNKDENSSGEMQSVLDAFTRIKIETKASVILIHHLNKNGYEDKGHIFNRLRGTGDFWAWRDCVIAIDGKVGAESAKCHIQFREAESPSPYIVRRAIDEESGTITMEASILEEGQALQDVTERIISAMKQIAFPTSKEKIYQSVLGKKTIFLSAFMDLANRGKITKDGAKWTLNKSS